jgi:rod shape-determining protein MreD
MMKRMLMLGSIFIGALVQLYLPPWPVFAGAKPPLLAAFVLYYALHRSRRSMWPAVFWAAVLHDSLDPGPLGPALLAFPVIGILANRIRSEIFVDGLVTQIICGLLGTWLWVLITLFVYIVGGQRPVYPVHVMLRLIGAGLLGMAALPAVSWAVNTLESALPKRREYGWQ